MGNYEDDKTQSLEIFSSFVEKTKAAMQSLVENIKENIKIFEIEISNSTRDARANEDSIKKCENEITRKTEEIETIKESIENVQNTFKKIVDAYSSTSRGETKDLYSEVIENARKNCEEETEKYQEEIATLNGDIEAINGNIKEFTQTGRDLEELIDKYTQELEKYKKALSFVNETVGKYNNRLDNINNNIIQTKREKGKPLNFGYTYYRPSELNSTVEHYNIGSGETVGEKFEEPTLESTVNFEDSLKQIYDLTGYTPPAPEEKEEETEEVEVKQEEVKDVEVNEDALKAEEFKIDTEETPEAPEEETKEEKKEEVKEEAQEEEVKEETSEEPKEEEEDSLSSDEIDEWEKILNSADDMLSNLNKASDEPKEEEKLVAPETKEEPKEEPAPEVKEEKAAPIIPDVEAIKEEAVPAPEAPAPEEPKIEAEAEKVAEEITNKEDDLNKETLEQLLKPYGTTYEKLSGNVSKEYTRKDGTKVPFELTLEDVIKAINAVDGNDLKQMKIVGPEITILKKVKSMKEGN